MPVGVSCYQNRYGSFGSRTELAMLAGSHWGRRSLAHTFNKCILMTVDRNESLLVEETRPEKGFFIKSKKRYYLLRDDKWHTKFTWEPVVVGDLWADETDGKCQMHFRVRMADTTRFQVDQPISRQRYNLFVGYKLDVHRVDLIEKVLHGKTKRLLEELRAGAKKCGQSLSQYCISLLSGKHPRAAFSEEELELLRNLKKERADVLLMFNAMIAELASLPDAERMRVVINDKSYDWWREHLITALEFFDQMRDRVSNAEG